MNRQSTFHRLAFLGAVSLGVIGDTVPSFGQTTTVALEREIGRIAASATARVGVGVIHVESRRGAFVNGDQWFPMASTYKVPIALTILNQAEQGRIRLDSLVPLDRADIVPFGSLLTERFADSVDPGVQLSIRRYLELMLTVSDNTATDVVLHTIGGTGTVMTRLRELGARDIDVTHTIMELGAAYLGFRLPPRSERTVAVVRRLMEQADPDRVKEGGRALLASRQDHTTPRAMAELLVQVATGKALGPKNTALLLELMTRDETGAGRLRGRLPPNVKVSSKSGTIQGTAENDVGIIVLPDGSRAVVVVYVTDAQAEPATLERIIADIGRAVYDFFAMEPPAKQ